MSDQEQKRESSDWRADRLRKDGPVTGEQKLGQEQEDPAQVPSGTIYKQSPLRREEKDRDSE